MVIAYDFDSGCPSSNPKWGLFTKYIDGKASSIVVIILYIKEDLCVCVTRMDGQTARLILTKISEWKAIYHGGNIGGRYSPNNPLRGRPHGVGLRKFKCVCVCVTRMDGQTACRILTKTWEWIAIYPRGNIGGVVTYPTIL